MMTNTSKTTAPRINDWTHPRTNEVRRYIANAAQLAGLVYETYKTGNIRSATLNGESISNRYANSLRNAKAWLDEQNELHIEREHDTVNFRAALTEALRAAGVTVSEGAA